MIDDIRKYRSIITEAVAGANLAKIAQNIKFKRFNINGYMLDSEYVIYAKETLPNETSVETIRVIASDIGFDAFGIISVEYEFDSGDEDYGYDIQDAKDWFNNGNYDDTLAKHLINAGFSPAAASTVEHDGTLADVVEYESDDIFDEMLAATHFRLEHDDINTLINELGVEILSLNVQFNITPSSINPSKRTILTYLVNNVHNTKNASDIHNILNTLTAAHVDWPELDTIKEEL